MAKIIASEQFELYLNERTSSSDPSFSHPAIQWTDKHVSFVELVYALYETGSFNNGNVTLSALADSLAQFFQIELAQDVNRIWLDIRNRKKAPDSYLQLLSAKLKERAAR